MNNSVHGHAAHDGGTMLAESENVAVFQCACGNIHLQIGAVSLTMRPAELAEVGSVVLRALAGGAPPDRDIVN